MPSASLGSLLLGEAILGSIEEGASPWEANIQMTMAVVGSLTLAVDFVANIPMTMAVSGGLTALISMAANIPMVMNMEAALRVARPVGRLRSCGDVLSTANQDWLLE